MHIAEVVTIAKSLPLLRLNTYKSLILSYSVDYRRILGKNRTHSRCYFVEMCAVYLYTLWINTIERRCCIRFACRISEHR